MDDLEFFEYRTHHKLGIDEDGEHYLIEQYQRWFVRLVRDSPKPALIKVGENLVELIWNEDCNGYVPPENLVTGASGLLRLYQKGDDETLKLLNPPLYIGPRNLTDAEFGAILARLGQLAIAHESGLLAPVTELSQDKLSSEAFENFLQLLQTLENSWEMIKKNPAKEINLAPQIVDVSDSRAQRHFRTVQYAVRKPYQLKQLIPKPLENYDTVENRFLVHVLEVILLKAPGYLEGIQEQIRRLKSFHSKPEKNFQRNYLIVWSTHQQETESKISILKERAIYLEKIIHKATNWLEESFLQGVTKKLTSSLHSAPKIAASQQYGPVYNAFQKYSTTLKHNPSKHGLTWALEEKAIKPAQNLYEIWVFLEIYAMFIIQFGFFPVGENLLDSVFVADGEFALPKGSEYSLAFTPKNIDRPVPLCKIKLVYNPIRESPECDRKKTCHSRVCSSLRCYRQINQTKDWRRLNPDILIIMEVGKNIKKFILDAKYRKYQEMTNGYSEQREAFQVATVFELDVLGTAKMKYLNGLEMDASFIIHTDPDPQYTLLGAEELPTRPHREQKLNSKYFPAHKVGAIYASPAEFSYLEKLIRSFLMYHLKLVNICWNCRMEVPPNKEKSQNFHSILADDYQCPDCGRFWIRTTCKNKHMLIKLGKDSFHKTHPDNEWHCVCPECDNSFATASKR